MSRERRSIAIATSDALSGHIGLLSLEESGHGRRHSHHGEAQSDGNQISELSELASSWLLIAIIAWAPFPLGSNRPWAWSLLVILIALAWLAWVPAALVKLEDTGRAARRLIVPGLLMGAGLVWAWLQTVPWMPASLHNSIWQIVPGSAAGKGAISMNPYVTATEAMKLLSYACAGWLAYALSRNYAIARRFFLAIVIIGVAYALYGMFLAAVHSSQVTLFENAPPPYGRDVSSGFVSKNSFATFDGIALLASVLLLIDQGREAVISSRGTRQLMVTAIQFALGRGIYTILAALVLFAALVTSDSRAGLLSTLVGLAVLFVYSLVFASRRGTARWALGVGAGVLVLMAFVFLVNGEPMQQRFDELIQTRGSEELRPVMWNAAQDAIDDHVWTGTGLGTFRDTYNLYSDRFDPYIFDKVHNDYLELSLGLGVPAAIGWVLAIVWMVGLCAIGVMRRHRRRHFALAAIAASALVGLHSAFDFSLQMPAVALLYATVLGMGVAQSSGRSASSERMHR